MARLVLQLDAAHWPERAQETRFVGDALARAQTLEINVLRPEAV